MLLQGASPQGFTPLMECFQTGNAPHLCAPPLCEIFALSLPSQEASPDWP